MITAAELTRFLRYPADQAISDQDAAQVEQVAIGWLSDPTGVESWAAPVPTVIKTWVLELAGIAYENPTSMENDQSLDNSSQWRDRRLQILAAAARWATRTGRGATTVALPTGGFPAVDPWPDPARGRW